VQCSRELLVGVKLRDIVVSCEAGREREMLEEGYSESMKDIDIAREDRS
jgi:hypothetical protein